MTHILHLDASGRQEESFSRKLSQQIVDRIKTPDAVVTYRDVGKGLTFVDNEMIESYFVAPEERTAQQKQVIEISDEVTNEVLAADTLVIGIPIYNFSMPAAFKAWADLVARVGITFRYGEHGPIGLLENKKAYVAVVSGGTPIDGEIDFLTPWIRQYLKFIGITDVQMVKAARMKRTPDISWESAQEQLNALT